MKKHLLNLFSVLSLLLFGFNASAQITESNFSALQVSAGLNAVFCPANAKFTLTASANDGNGNTYSSYQWSQVNEAGGADALSETSASLSLENVTPGYHTYRVYGVTAGDGASCKADEFQDFTVYVLPPLTVSASVPDATVLKYCMNDVRPEGDPKAIVLTASVDGFSTTPYKANISTVHTAADFGYDYKWYRVDASNVRTEVGTNQSTYTVNGTDAGTFTYQCDITYKVKNVCAAFTATVKRSGADAKIIVTPVPGKPTITIQ